MFFLLRCAFFLSLIYTSIILSQGGWRGVPTTSLQAGKTLMDDTAKDPVSAVLRFCGARSSDCLADASRLSALIAAGDDAPARAAASVVSPTTAPVPMPIPRPHAR